LALAKNNKAGGFSDWLIPTAYELNMIYQNLKIKNLGNFLDSNFTFKSETENKVWE
jgi:hypothetical protein